jgi:hypothetical protein
MSQSVINEFNYTNSNAFSSFMEKLADTAYHEIGHHVHSKTEEYLKLDGERSRLLAKLRCMKGTPDENAAARVRCRILNIEYKVEDYARAYAADLLPKATALQLLNATPENMLFFKIQFDRFRHECMEIYEKNRHDKDFIGMWSQITGIFDYIRKRKISDEELYNVRETFELIFDASPEKRLVTKFKAAALKQVNPLFYTSKTNRKFAYFTQAHVEQLKNHFTEAGSPFKPDAFPMRNIHDWKNAQRRLPTNLKKSNNRPRQKTWSDKHERHEQSEAR